MKKFWKKRRFGEKGLTSIELVIAIMIIMILFVFSLDILEISFKNYSIQNISRSVIRTLSVQGGVSTNTPVTSSELIDRVEYGLENSGIDPQTARATFNQGSASPLNSLRFQTELVDFREPVYFRIEIDHEWHIARWFGIEQTSTFSAQKEGISEHFRPEGGGW